MSLESPALRAGRRIVVYEYLSGGGPVPDPQAAAELLRLGVTMRDALVRQLLQVPGVSVSYAVCDGAPALADAPGARPLQAAAGEDALAFVQRIAAEHDAAWVVAPETHGLLAAFAEAVGPQRWIGCAAETIRATSSKRATGERLAAAGLLTPQAFAGGATAWVVKPDDGAGCVDTRRYTDAAAAQAAADARSAAGERVRLEPWVEGEPMSASLLCDGQGRAELLSVNRQRITEAADGTLGFDGLALDVAEHGDTRWRALQRVAHGVAQALPGLRGYAGIDLVWHAERGPVLIEVNPRITCAFVGLSEALRRPLAAQILSLFP